MAEVESINGNPISTAKLDAYMEYQSAYQNDISQPVEVREFPDPPSGYRMQGFTIGNDGAVYVAYFKDGTGTILRKYSNISGSGVFSTVAELTLSSETHANSLNIQNGKIIIADTGSRRNVLKTVDVASFTEGTSITLPYNGINTAAYMTLNGEGYIVGRLDNGGGIQLYQYNSDLTRPEAYADRFLQTPVSIEYVQGCCANNGMFYLLHSLTHGANSFDQSYIAVYSPSTTAGGMPAIYPLGVSGYEFEDIAIYNGHMYVCTTYRLFDLGTDIVKNYDQYRSTSNGAWAGDLVINKIGYSVAEWFEGNKVPKTIVLPNALREIIYYMPERVMFRWWLHPTGHRAVSSGWCQLIDNKEYTVLNATGSSLDVYTLALGSRSGVNLTISELVRSSVSSGYSQAVYPAFSLNSFNLEFAIRSR